MTLNRTLLPRIELKGNGSQFLSSPLSANNQQSNFVRVNSNNSEYGKFKRNFTQNQNPFNNILNVSSLLHSQPYQLTRFGTSSTEATLNSNIIRNQSDFYDNNNIDNGSSSETETIKFEEYESSIRSDQSKLEKVMTNSSNNLLFAGDILKINQKKNVENLMKPRSLKRISKLANRAKNSSVTPSNSDVSEISLPLVSKINLAKKNVEIQNQNLQS